MEVVGKIPDDCIVILEDKEGVRKFITNNNIIESIGWTNANKVIKTTIKLDTDMKTIKFRKCGKIEIWLK